MNSKEDELGWDLVDSKGEITGWGLMNSKGDIRGLVDSKEEKGWSIADS